MKVNLEQVIHNFSGVPYQTEEGDEATIRFFLNHSFDVVNTTDSKLSINEQLKLYSVAKRLATKRKEITVTADEAKLLIHRMTQFSIPIVGTLARVFKINHEQI